MLCRRAKLALMKQEVAPESRSAEVCKEQWDKMILTGILKVGAF